MVVCGASLLFSIVDVCVDLARKEEHMIEEEMRSNWYYFCSLSEQLYKTAQYVDHSVDGNNNMFNGNAFSYEFVKLIMLSSSEFEVMARKICNESGITIRKNANIIAISKALLGRYPQIGKTTIVTPYMKLQPLIGWHVGRSGKKELLCGLNWWGIHNELKHERKDSFKKGTLNNCIESMASLMVLELYLDRITGLGVLEKVECEYFQNMYAPSHLITESGPPLPDFARTT